MSCVLKQVLDEDAEDMSSTSGSGPVPGHEILKELSRGGMGVVYLAHQHNPARDVAIKMLLPWQMDVPSLRARFQLEAEALSLLDHQAILPLYQVGTADGVPWFSMKLALGGSLQARRDSYAGRWRDIVLLMEQLTEAVSFAHQRGVLHRDLKPGNVLFDEHDRPYLADFGLAKMLDHAIGSTITQSRSIMGTPQYLAPEVAEAGAQQATTASDVYGLGAVFYELLAQRPPFVAPTLTELLRAVCQDDPPPIMGKNSTTQAVPRDLEVIVRKCLRKAPGARYASAAALAADLRAWLTGQPISAQPATVIMRIKAWTRRRPALAASLAVLGVSTMGTAAAQWRSIRETATARKDAESLVEYMNGTLTNKLAPSGRLDLLTEVNSRLAQWYAQQPADRETRDPQFALQRAHFLFNQARAQLAGGDYHGAETSLNASMGIARLPNVNAQQTLLHAAQTLDADAQELLGTSVIWELGRHLEAQKHLTSALAWYQAQPATLPPNLKVIEGIGRIQHVLAIHALDMDQHQRAESLWKANVAALGPVARLPGARAELQRTLAETNFGFGRLAQIRGESGNGASQFRDWRDQMKALTMAYPADLLLQDGWSEACSYLAGALDGIPETQVEAHAAFRDSRSVCQQLCAQDPFNLSRQHELAKVDLAFGQSLKKASMAEAETVLREGVAIGASLLGRTTDPTPWLPIASGLFDHLAILLDENQRHDEAQTFLQTQLQAAEIALDGSPARYFVLHEILNDTCASLQRSNPVAAKKFIQDWQSKARTTAAQAGPGGHSLVSWTAIVSRCCAIEAYHCWSEDPAQAIKLYQQAQQLIPPVLTAWPRVTRLDQSLTSITDLLISQQLQHQTPQSATESLTACFNIFSTSTRPLHHKAVHELAETTRIVAAASHKTAPAAALALVDQALKLLQPQPSAAEDRAILALTRFPQ
jgi:predicted Ser/Thr protein kinase